MTFLPIYLDKVRYRRYNQYLIFNPIYFMAIDKVDLFRAGIKTLDDLFAASRDAETATVPVEGPRPPARPVGPQFHVDVGARLAEVRARIVELFGNGLLGVGMKVGKGSVPESGRVAGQVTPWVTEPRFQQMLRDAARALPGQNDPALAAGAAFDRTKGGAFYLGRFIDLMRESGDGRSVAELLAEFTDDPIAGVNLDSVPWVGQQGKPGSGDVLASRFYQQLSGGDSVQFRIVAGITYSRYKNLMNSVGAGTELGRAFQTLVSAFYKKFEAVTPGERFKVKNPYMREQWLGVLCKNLSAVPTSSWIMDEWNSALEECKTTDDLVGFVKSFAGQE